MGRMGMFILLAGLAATAFSQEYNDPNAKGYGAAYDAPEPPNPANRNKDVAQCKYEAAKATAAGPVGSIFDSYGNNAFVNALTAGVRQGELMALCMQAKGYDRW